jgi:hypothetical protein
VDTAHTERRLLVREPLVIALIAVATVSIMFNILLILYGHGS